MERKPTSMTVKQLITVLKKQPQDWPVFFSVDPEGNGFGELGEEWLVGGSNEDKVIVLYPVDSSWVDDDIIPLEMKKIMAQIEKERKEKNE